MKIHIIGASGSGTTTLGKALSKKLNYAHFDTDDYFWEDTDPPFQKKRERKIRQDMLEEDLINHDNWVLSGTLCATQHFPPPASIAAFTAFSCNASPPNVRNES